jgi:hypothetical protein
MGFPTVSLGEAVMHPLDEKYWSKRENWKWWCYTCPDDPRTIVSKRPRWTGYTINVAHRRSWSVLTCLVALILRPVLAAIVIIPESEFAIPAVSGITIAITIVICHRMANPKTEDEGISRSGPRD